MHILQRTHNNNFSQLTAWYNIFLEQTLDNSVDKEIPFIGTQSFITITLSTVVAGGTYFRFTS
jgi:hypothetical protein